MLKLAFQSIGVEYGDIGTSPLYVFSTIFPNGVKYEEDILGALSLIFSTITFIPAVKYVFIVLQANDNGDGGTFALYSLICGYSKVGLIPSTQAEDKDVSTFKLDIPDRRTRRASKLKSILESSNFAKFFLLFATMLGTSMVIGDGVLTPCVSVLSAIRGVKAAAPSVMTEDYFKRNKKDAWISLGGVVMCITGGEALFADVGHFSVRSVHISMCCVTYPALILEYLGQTAYLRKHSDDVTDTFYKNLPHSLYWPVFGVAVLPAIIASQALISGTFAIIQQSLGCFPRVKIVHTSIKYHGQIYIPEINTLLMLAYVVVTLAFRTTEKLSNAYANANRVSTDESTELENDGSNIYCDKQAEDATILMKRDIEVLEREFDIATTTTTTRSQYNPT